MQPNKADIILELANESTSTQVDKILNQKGITIIPDILANSGGVAVSYFDWYQNVHQETWTKQQVFQKLHTKIKHAVEEINHLSKKHHLSLRDSAYLLALTRLKETPKT